MNHRVVALVTIALAFVAFPAAALGAPPQDLHCPAGWDQKVETGDLNDIVLPAGTVFCVKGSTGNTGKLVADGETTLVEYLGNGHDVSHYVVYKEVSPSPSPTGTPTPTVTASPTPTGSESPSPTSSPTTGSSTVTNTPSPSTPPETSSPTGTPTSRSESPKPHTPTPSLSTAETGPEIAIPGVLAVVLGSGGLAGLYLARRRSDDDAG